MSEKSKNTPTAEQQAITSEFGAVYAELPDFDSGDEPIWEAVFNWKAATPGSDAHKKAVAVESAIINSLRDFADRTHALRMEQAAPKAAQGVGNSGFDHKTAADLLNNKTVSDEAVRKFVATSRWAHDERASLSATLLAMHGVLTSREAEIALLKKALLEAEAAPKQEAQEPAHPSCKSDMTVNGGALKLALNVLRRAGKTEVADELEKTAQPAPATQQAGAAKENLRLVRVIADKIEDGTLFQSGIYSKKDLARFVRNVADAAAPQPSPTAQADSQPGDKDLVAVPRDLIGAACSAIDKKRDGARTLAELRRYTVGDLSAAITSAPKAEPVELSADSLRHQNKLLAETLGACILASGIVRKDIDGFTGPELLHFGEDLRSMLEVAPKQEAQEPAFVDVSLRTAIAKAVYQQVRVEFEYRLCAWTALDADEQQRIVDSIRGLYIAPQPAPAPPSDDAVKDAARYEYLRDCPMRERSRLEHYSGPALDVVIDAARKQGVNHD